MDKPNSLMGGIWNGPYFYNHNTHTHTHVYILYIIVKEYYVCMDVLHLPPHDLTLARNRTAGGSLIV